MSYFNVAAVFLAATLSDALHPRPQFDNYASFARWLVHESDYAVVSTHHKGSEVFGNIISIADGNGYEDSTGVILTYLPDLDVTFMDLAVDSRVALTFSEMALGDGRSGGCVNSTAETPPCGRVTITGRMTLVPESHKALALKYLFARHPIMKSWGEQHNFQPFWIAKENMTDLFVIDMYGGGQHPSAESYFAAPWHGTLPPAGSWNCAVCGHIYNATRDGDGKSFEELPDSW
eukprot:CAMPEP_0170609258 /NCGR_PEP_ID=MMETSP0224-20130122/22026_1 /TAXON_ID=285029 /ORGANISM="Togula jolla, Strain CCCM 725" /LENGTH=232 /DNA_ID=CAMNT_0010934547 /DNA_START=77 /DNA_END=772 /DNA_ORIENTATION=+